MSCDFIALASPGVQGLTPYQPGKPIEEVQRELGLERVVKLASNENPLGPSPLALEAARAALAGSHRYPDSSGYLLKGKLARRLDVEPSQLVLGNGSNDVLDLIARAFLGPGTSAVYSRHAFVVYPIAVQACGARALVTPARDWGHDLDAMAAAIEADTRVVFIANPNNPTGTWVPRAELERFLQRVPEHVVVVLDEAYNEYVEAPEFPDALALLRQHPNLVVTRTFSKAYGLAALRVGYSLSNPQIADLLNRVRAPFNVTSAGLAAAAAALDDADYLRDSVRVNREGMAQLEAGLERLGLRWIPSVGNFIAVEFEREAAALYQALLREGVIVRPVGVYDMPRHLRVSIGLADENAALLSALQRVLA